MTVTLTITAGDGAKTTVALPDPTVSGGAPVPDVTGFSGTNAAQIRVDNHVFEVENANKSYSLTKPDSQTLRFEMRSGDHWTDGTERSEVECQTHYPSNEAFGYNSNTSLSVAYDFMLELGNLNTAAWMIIGQWHGGTVVPFSFALAQEKLQVVVRNSAGAATVLYTDPNPIQRGRYYSMAIKINFGAKTLSVTRDGVQIASSSTQWGVVGERNYWKMGIYRAATTNDIQAANYRNFVISP